MLTIGLKAIGAVFFMVLPLAVFFAAAMLAIALFAKSYKEAQSYISPLMIVAIIPAIGGMLPGVEFNSRLAMIPVLSTSLICKEIVSGTLSLELHRADIPVNVRLCCSGAVYCREALPSAKTFCSGPNHFLETLASDTA